MSRMKEALFPEVMFRNLILKIEHDPNTEDPCQNDQFQVISFNSRHVNYRYPSEGRPDIGTISKLNHQTAWWLDYYEHGLCQWSLAGTGPQCRWDTSRHA